MVVWLVHGSSAMARPCPPLSGAETAAFASIGAELPVTMPVAERTMSWSGEERNDPRVLAWVGEESLGRTQISRRCALDVRSSFPERPVLPVEALADVRGSGWIIVGRAAEAGERAAVPVLILRAHAPFADHAVILFQRVEEEWSRVRIVRL